MRNGVIVWTLVGGFLVGVAARSFFPLGLSFAMFIAFLGIAALYFLRSSRGALYVALALFAAVIGIVRMNFAIVQGDPLLTARANEQITILGRVFEEPDVREASTRISVEADTVITKYTKERVHGGILVVVPPHADISYGDRVLTYGTLRLPEAFDTGEGRQFNYPEYLAVHGIQYELTGAQIERNDGNSGNPVKAFAIQTKQWYLRGEHTALPEPEAGLASGITVGDKRAIGSELSDTFRAASLVHIVVFSGYHVGVIGNAARYFVQWLPRVPQYGIVSLVILFFVLMSGGAASAVRAGAMALIAIYARASGRTFLAGRALAVVAAGMVLYDPLLLAFDPSYQLSVLAMTGIIALTPRIFSWLTWIPERFGLREILASTAGAQLAVLPLLIYQNGYVSLVSLPANVFALAPVPYAMFFSFLAGLSGLALGPYAAPLAAPAYFLLAYVIGAARFFAGLPFATVAVPAFSAWWLVLAYALLFSAAWWFNAAGVRKGEADGPRREATAAASLGAY